jgi:hypothetical protein
MVTLIVGIIGFLAAWIPIRVMKKQYFMPGTQDE